VNDGLVNVKPKPKFTDLVSEQDEEITAVNQGMINNIVFKNLDNDKGKGSPKKRPNFEELEDEDDESVLNGGDMNPMN
jgi:hypothetical protein